MKKLLPMLLMAFAVCAQAQAQSTPKYIVFYKAYTDTLETDLYRDTVIKFDSNIQYENVKNASVRENLGTAVKNNDFRFISIGGYSNLFPGLEGGYKKDDLGVEIFIGLDEKYLPYLRKYHFKVIAGTSNTINVNDPPLQTAAYDYAKKYNQALFKIISK